MDTGTRAGRVIALISRRAPAFRPPPGAPHSPAEAYYRAHHLRQATAVVPPPSAHPTSQQTEARTLNKDPTIVGEQKILRHAHVKDTPVGLLVMALLTAVVATVVSVFLWTGNFPATRNSSEFNPPTLAFSHDGKILATTARTPSVLLRSTTTGRSLAVIRSPRPVRAISFSPDSKILAAGDDDGTVQLWNLATPDDPTLLGVLPDTGHGHVDSLAFTSGSTTLAVSYEQHTVGLWDVPTRRAVKYLNVPGLTATALTGRILVTGDYRGTVRLWDLTDPRAPVQTSLLSTDDKTTDHEITNVALSPDGGTLAVSEYDGTVRLYNITDPTKPLVARVLNSRGHYGVTTMAFGSKRTPLAIAYDDGTIFLANGATYNEMTYIGKSDVTALVFGPTGRILEAIDDHETLHAWKVTEP